MRNPIATATYGIVGNSMGETISGSVLQAGPQVARNAVRRKQPSVRTMP